MGIQLQVFNSTIPSVNFILKNGKPCIFQAGVFRTDNPAEIAELDSEILQGHPHIKRPANEAERVIDSEMVDPMNALRAKIIAEYEAERTRAMDADANVSNYTAEQVKPANSNDIAVAAAGGSGATLVANLAQKLAKA
jgi:hypothetical protein